MTLRQERIVAAVGFGSLLLGAVAFHFSDFRRGRVNQWNCVSNLKQVGLGTMQYVRDFDEVMPRAENWSRALWPYTRSVEIFQCPARLATGYGAIPQGYAFHRSATEASLSAFDNEAAMVLVFDSDGRFFDTTDNGTSLPQSARHPAGHGILFADGHVKLTPRPNFLTGYDMRFFYLNALSRRDSKEFWRKIEARAAAKREVRRSNGQNKLNRH